MRLIRSTPATVSAMLLGLAFLGMSTAAHAADNNDGCTITTTTNGDNNHITNACGRITYGDNAVNGSGHTITTGVGQLGAAGNGDSVVYQVTNNSGVNLGWASKENGASVFGVIAPHHTAGVPINTVSTVFSDNDDLNFPIVAVAPSPQGSLGTCTPAPGWTCTVDITNRTMAIGMS